MVQVTFNLDPALLDTVDDTARKLQQTRSRFITEVIRTYFAPKEPSSTEVVLLTKDLDHLNEIMAMRESEIVELKEVNGRLWSEWHDANARLVQYQLPAPKPRVGFWARFRRKKE